MPIFATPNPIRIVLPSAAGVAVAHAFAFSFHPFGQVRLTINTPLITIKQENPFMSTLTLSRSLTPADVGSGTWVVTAHTADGSFSSTLSIMYTISASEGAPIWNPASATVSLMDNAAAGADVWTGTLTNSDGSVFNGTVDVGAAPLTFAA